MQYSIYIRWYRKSAWSHLPPSFHLICSEVRECLKLDPDHKQCYSHYKLVKKLNKQIQSAEELMQEQRWALIICVCAQAIVYSCKKKKKKKNDLTSEYQGLHQLCNDCLLPPSTPIFRSYKKACKSYVDVNGCCISVDIQYIRYHIHKTKKGRITRAA